MPSLRKLLASVAIIAAPALAATTTPVSAYPIDCAILLCLAGGWPASAECTTARLEFIRRITPFPVEPPLQIWRCPLGASYEAPSPTERLWSIASTGLPAQSTRSGEDMIRYLAVRIASGPTADVDISDLTYDFVRSIRVYHIDWYHREVNSSGGGDCSKRGSLSKIGTYGIQGDFSWNYMDIYDAPSWMNTGIRRSSNCEAAGRFRGVGVEWTDYFGDHGHELVSY